MNGEQYLTDEYRQSMADGEQTIFNMASGMCGAMYLSGKLDRADEANLELVQSGVRLYKRLRPFLCRAVPFYPLPLPHIPDRGFAALGLRAGEEAIVTVWRKDAPEDTAVLPLPGVCGIEEIYPCRSIRAELGEDAVTVTLPKARQAAVFRVKFGA